MIVTTFNQLSYLQGIPCWTVYPMDKTSTFQYRNEHMNARGGDALTGTGSQIHWLRALAVKWELDDSFRSLSPQASRTFGDVTGIIVIKYPKYQCNRRIIWGTNDHRTSCQIFEIRSVPKSENNTFSFTPELEPPTNSAVSKSIWPSDGYGHQRVSGWP